MAREIILQKVYLKLMSTYFFKKIVENIHKESVAEILKMKLPTSVIIFYTKLRFFLSSYRRPRVAYNSHHVLQEPHRR